MKPNNLRFHLHSAVLLCAAAALLRLASPACAQSGDITSSIPDQAEGVALNVPMIFTFSQAVNTAQAFVTFVQMSPSQGLVNVTKTWGAGNTQLTCTPDGGNWPPQAEIQWSVTVLSGGFPSMMGAGVFTTGTGGGTTDTDPPTLVSSFPTNNTTGVPLNRTIRFTFNEAMQPFESVQWSANLTPTKFTYDWVNANTLTCAYSENLPANATVTWKLNPTGSPALFKDAAGNALAADINAGSFTTSNTTTNDPCNPDPGDTSLG